MPLEYPQRHFLRCQAESNCCTWFCRPMPNRSAIAPFGITKIVKYFEKQQYFD